jgi:hypothetical protein
MTKAEIKEKVFNMSMKLDRDEADLFFDLTWRLQFYVNRKNGIINGIATVEEYIELPQDKKMLVRNSLYDSLGLIDDYIGENPDKLSDEKLGIVEQWKLFIRGEFHIERYLKNYAIFIGGDNVYGVVGLYQSFDEIFTRRYLPVYVKTVLLPFKGKLVYDGLMETYNIHFGGGIKRSLKEAYMTAKQNDEIVTQLDNDDSGDTAAVQEVLQKDWSKEMAQLILTARKLKGGAGQPVINGAAFALVRATIELANRVVLDSEDVDVLDKELRRVKRAARKIETIMYRME